MRWQNIAEPGLAGFKMNVDVSMAPLALRLGSPHDSPTVDACDCFDSPADGQI